MREYAEYCSKSLPRDSAPNRSLFDVVVASNTLRAVKKRSTVFVTDLLQSHSALQIGGIPGVAQMHDRDIPSPDISSAHRGSSFFNLSALRREGSGISHSLCVSLPLVQRGSNVSLQSSTGCDCLVLDLYPATCVDFIRGDSDGKNRISPPFHSSS